MVKKNENVKEKSSSGSKKKKYTEIESGSKKKNKNTEISSGSSGSKKNTHKEIAASGSKKKKKFSGWKRREIAASGSGWYDDGEEPLNSRRMKKRQRNAVRWPEETLENLELGVPAQMQESDVEVDEFGDVKPKKKKKNKKKVNHANRKNKAKADVDKKRAPRGDG